LAPPLGLVLRSARWVTHETAARCRVAFAGLHAELAAECGAARGPVARFWQLVPRVFPILTGDTPTEAFVATEVKRELQRRWSGMLGLDDTSQREVRRTSAELAARLDEWFPPSAPGWQLARYQSVDTMLAAPDVAAVNRGDY